MVTVHFYAKKEIAADKLKYAVIVARYNNQWVFCRHKKRSTWEIPGGHKEYGETPYQAARRELYEETGAEEFTLKELCIYGVEQEEKITYGMLCYAEINTLGPLPAEMEMEEIRLCSEMPESLTYPQIQPALFSYVQRWMKNQTV